MLRCQCVQIWQPKFAGGYGTEILPCFIGDSLRRLQAVLTSEDYDFCMETRFKWPFSVLLAVPVMLVAHAVPGKPFAQSERTSTTHNAAGRQSNGHDDWARAPQILQT